MRLIAIGIVVLALFIGSRLPDPPREPVRDRRLTVWEFCAGPDRTDWCTEFYQDLADGREERKRLQERNETVEEDPAYEDMEPFCRED